VFQIFYFGEFNTILFQERHGSTTFPSARVMV
jgi:hypothetical protein